MKIKENKKMFIYILALVILAIFSIAIFTVHVLYMYLVALATAFVVEFVFTKFRKKEPNFIYWFQTPLLFVLFLPSQAPLWLVLYGTLFAVLFGKAVFGGDDNYVFNPAIVGMLFVTVSFPQQMNNEWYHPIIGFVGSDNTANALQSGILTDSIRDLLLGSSAGSVGEVFRLLILILGVGLMVFKIIDWKIPVSFLVSYFLFNLFGNMSSGNFNLLDALTPLLVGTVMLSAFFAAPDEPTAAKYPIGRIIYGIGFGFFTYIIRTFSTFPDGVIFVIIIMNTLAPLIDKIEFNKFNPKKEDVETSEVEVTA